jgi:spore germination protein YaaH
MAVLLTGLATPASASDPPGGATATPEEMLQPGVHGEMLLEHAKDEGSFAEGGTPEVLRSEVPGETADGGPTVQADGAVAGLPNGLRREVFGYLPHWYLTDANLAHLDYRLVSTIAYFGVAATSTGQLSKSGDTWGGWASSRMTSVINAAHSRGVKVVLTVTMMAWNGDYTAMSTLLNSSTNRTRLVNEIVATVRARNADGVNLDFEPVPTSLKAQYTSFVKQLKAGLTAGGAGSYLTVATMAGAATWPTGYDVPGLTAAGAADALMVMAYDFSWSGSARAGGVAPIDNPYIFDVRTAMNAYLAKAPASKLIWGVPYYGRGWTTQTDQRYALTCKTKTVCPNADSSAIGRTWAPRYVDALSGIAAHPPRIWDGTGQVPWYRYYESSRKAWTQVYYDDAASLGAKYTLVEANGLRGIGIWSLAMDVGRRELWNQIDDYFRGIWFEDILGNQFFGDIMWIAKRGITGGCGELAYCPSANVTREQMAAFLARALKLPAASRDYFDDDAGTMFEGEINRLAASGITGGCASRRFCPKATITRGQLAAFLARALKLPATGRDYFDDDAGTMFEGEINRLAASGITGGCGTRRFCPSGVVKRDQMAAFLHRSLLFRGS